MEIRITPYFGNIAPMDLSASVAEIGNDAGAYTWQASIEASAELNLLDSDEKRQAFREFVKESGGWDESEISEWSDMELNALFMQWISSDLREMGVDHSDDAIDWEDIESAQQSGQYPSNILKGIDGEIYFYTGH